MTNLWFLNFHLGSHSETDLPQNPSPINDGDTIAQTEDVKDDTHSNEATAEQYNPTSEISKRKEKATR